MTQLHVPNADWRTKLGGHLRAHAGTTLSVGDLWDQFGVELPLHHATRIWIRQYGELCLTDRPMRWRAFVTELLSYPLRPEPSLAKHRKLTLGHTVLPLWRPCRRCMGLYFNRKDTVTCSRSCAALLWRAARSSTTVLSS